LWIKKPKRILKVGESYGKKNSFQITQFRSHFTFELHNLKVIFNFWIGKWFTDYLFWLLFYSLTWKMVFTFFFFTFNKWIGTWL